MALQKASHHEDMYSYEDSDDSDWEPLQEPTAVAKWFCVNCTMVNFEDVLHCDVFTLTICCFVILKGASLLSCTCIIYDYSMD